MPRPSAGVAAGGFNVTSRVKGGAASARNIRAMDKATRKKFFDELVDIADDILDRSKEYVPYLTGDLHDSGTVIPHPGRYPSVEIGFGGVAVNYAVLQHENTEFKHAPGRKAKYLELAVKDFEPTMKHRLAVATGGEMRLYDMRGKVTV